MRMRWGRKAPVNAPASGETGSSSIRQTTAMRAATGISREVAISLARQAMAAPYRAYIAATEEERRAAYRLRFRVFNLELQEGLDGAFATGEDMDQFDGVCDHIIVEDARTNNVVGTYRLQTGRTAERHLGYYSEREFDFSPYKELRGQL